MPRVGGSESTLKCRNWNCRRRRSTTRPGVPRAQKCAGQPGCRAAEREGWADSKDRSLDGRGQSRFCADDDDGEEVDNIIYRTNDWGEPGVIFLKRSNLNLEGFQQRSSCLAAIVHGGSVTLYPAWDVKPLAILRESSPVSASACGTRLGIAHSPPPCRSLLKWNHLASVASPPTIHAVEIYLMNMMAMKA